MPFGDTTEPGDSAAPAAPVAWTEPWLAAWFGTGWGSGRYNAGMNPSLATLPTLDGPLGSLGPTIADVEEAPGVPAGLTVADATRIAEAMSACHAESTRAIYAGAWQRWEHWCSARDISPMPAHPAAICAYLTDRAATGLSIGALDTDCSAIAYTHRRHRLPDPLCDEAVRAVRRGLRRIVGTAPRRQARPLGTPEIRQILEAIDRTTPKGARDAAIILLGFASALRRSELAALTLDDIDTQPSGLVITVRSSKTDQEAAGQCVGVAHGQHEATDPVAALHAWLSVRGSTPGPVFTSLRHRRVTLDPFLGDGIAIMLRRRARDAGLAAERITPHSLRAGHATEAALAGVALDRIAAQTRHRRLSTLLERYIRPAQALQLTTSRDLGL